MALFDSYLMVDWSASSHPKRGKDSIWIGLTETGKPVRLMNPSTRHSAAELVLELSRDCTRRKKRLLLGFDFPFGFPRGTGNRLGLNSPAWEHTWEFLDRALKDDWRNSNNRFDVAEQLNRELYNEPFPFWGNTREEERKYLKRRGCRKHTLSDLHQYRICDRACADAGFGRPMPVWKLAGIGSVGSQALTGIPRLRQIRKHRELKNQCRIWPFETGLQYDPRPRALIAEIYPSIVPPLSIAGKPKDAGQVAAIGQRFRDLDRNGELEQLFRPSVPDDVQRRAVEGEEGWILGV